MSQFGGFPSDFTAKIISQSQKERFDVFLNGPRNIYCRPERMPEPGILDMEDYEDLSD